MRKYKLNGEKTHHIVITVPKYNRENRKKQ
jgi:hypothetical protein